MNYAAAHYISHKTGGRRHQPRADLLLPMASCCTRANKQYADRACEAAQLVQGRVSEWLSSRLGWAAGSMLPSVRCGLEGALLSALAAARRQPLHALLTACTGNDPCCCWQPPVYQRLFTTMWYALQQAER